MILTALQITELQSSINRALHRLYNDDISLIDRHVNERAVVFRFGLYFNEELSNSIFRGYNLDCEYNRNMGDPKRTENFPNGVIPDVLLHRRNSNEENILVIEFKGHWNDNDRDNDRRKIVDFTNQRGTYKYGLGALIEVERERPRIEYQMDYTPEV